MKCLRRGGRKYDLSVSSNSPRITVLANLKFTSDNVSRILASLPEPSRYWVAYSGGLDSHVLLHILSTLKQSITAEIAAVHINHGISEQAAEWSDHCAGVCEVLGIKMYREKIDESCPAGASVEAWARKHRYRLLGKYINSGDMLLTAHHQDDQAETLLLQLLRGAGTRGLSAMPQLRRMGPGWHARPLLAFSREQLRNYAGQAGLQWIEDGSNRDPAYDRNYLRRYIFPLLDERWPGVSRILARAAAHQAESVALTDDLARLDLMEIRLQHHPNALDIQNLATFTPARMKNLLRYWLRELGLPVPGTKKLQHIISDVIHSKREAAPCVSWEGAEIRRYRDRIIARQPLAPHDPARVLQWKLAAHCSTGMGELQAVMTTGSGIRADAVSSGTLEVRFRSGGENLMPAGSKHHQTLKKLFQQRGILPWYRNRIPLLYIDGRLAAVAGFWIDADFAAGAGEPSWEISWSERDRVV
jgi:tRNA(Ile)-lysidine synthase